METMSKLKIMPNTYVVLWWSQLEPIVQRFGGVQVATAWPCLVIVFDTEANCLFLLLNDMALMQLFLTVTKLICLFSNE